MGTRMGKSAANERCPAAGTGVDVLPRSREITGVWLLPTPLALCVTHTLAKICHWVLIYCSFFLPNFEHCTLHFFDILSTDWCRIPGTMKLSTSFILSCTLFLCSVAAKGNECPPLNQPTVAAPLSNPWKALSEEEAAGVDALLQRTLNLTSNEGSRYAVHYILHGDDEPTDIALTVEIATCKTDDLDHTLVYSNSDAASLLLFSTPTSPTSLLSSTATRAAFPDMQEQPSSLEQRT
jgi:hypothetical protein